MNSLKQSFPNSDFAAPQRLANSHLPLVVVSLQKVGAPRKPRFGSATLKNTRSHRYFSDFIFGHFIEVLSCNRPGNLPENLLGLASENFPSADPPGNNSENPSEVYSEML